MITIYDITLVEDDYLNKTYNFQLELTKKLDNLNSDFDQNIINEIVLWKVNRFSLFDDETFELLNSITKEQDTLDIDLTRNILEKLLSRKGVQLPMASTVLRFKNPNIYQIIDQRVYRFIYGENLPVYFSSTAKQIDLYINYLDKLSSVCIEKNINFSLSDRIIYELDKQYNKKEKIKY